jgi:beta-lactamase class D
MVVVDANSGKTLVREGRCDQRHTPASTFKIALAAMGFDSGFLKDEHAPALPFRDGYPAWGGEAWKQPTDPTRWLQYSVVWYSQQVTHALGEAKLHDYATRFAYGNADLSGDPGKHNGLDRSWISSSLQISPREQVGFLRKLVTRTLPISPRATDMTLGVVEETKLPSGWVVKGKTGMAYPRKSDRSFDEAHPWGWFVGWATKENQIYVFARLIQDDAKTEGTAGVRCREAFLAEWPALLAKGGPR